MPPVLASRWEKGWEHEHAEAALDVAVGERSAVENRALQLARRLNLASPTTRQQTK